MGDKKKGWNYYSLMTISYATMIMFGVLENTKGVTFTSINKEFQVSYDQQGYLVSFSWYGYVIFCLVCAFVMKRWGLKPAILCGYIFNCLGCIAAAYAPNFATVVLSLMVLWMGFGFYEVGYNALASILFTENSAVYLNLMHFFYGFGAIVGPQVASWLERLLNDSYRGVYRGLFFVMAVLFIFSIIIPYSAVEKKQSNNEESNGSISISSMFKMPYIWVASITLGFMEVMEFLAANWGTLYYRDVYGLDPNKEGATFLSFFYVMFTITRLVSGYIIERLGYYTSLFGVLVIVIIIYIVGLLMGVNGRWVIPLTGFFIGTMFPTYMCVLMKVFGDEAGNMSSIVIFLSGATNGLVQLIIGYVNEWIGYEWGFRAGVIYTLIPCILLFITKKMGEEVSKSFNKPKLNEIEMSSVVEIGQKEGAEKTIEQVGEETKSIVADNNVLAAIQESQKEPASESATVTNVDLVVEDTLKENVV